MNRKKIRVAAIIGFGIVSLFLAYEFFLWAAWDFSPNYSQADGCLDHGGCWDSVDKVCRKEEANAQALCDRAKQK